MTNNALFAPSSSLIAIKNRKLLKIEIKCYHGKEDKVVEKKSIMRSLSKIFINDYHKFTLMPDTN